VVPPVTVLASPSMVVAIPVGPTLGQSSGGGGLAPLVLVVAVVVAVTLPLYLAHRKRRRKEQDLWRLVERDPTLRPSPLACGLGPDELAGRFLATPRGDRRYGLRYGVTGPLRATTGVGELLLEAACFQWWSEQRRSTTSGPNGHRRSTYHEQTTVVLVARLPAHAPSRVRIGPESLLGRVGLTRGGQQLESSEFNRRFRVDGGDPAVTVKLLDAGLQERLLAEFQGRTIEVQGDLVVLGGEPAHRDGSLTGVIGALPAVRQDLVRLLAAVPAAWWRRLGVDEGSRP
jgi:hypothetical protein